MKESLLEEDIKEKFTEYLKLCNKILFHHTTIMSDYYGPNDWKEDKKTVTEVTTKYQDILSELKSFVEDNTIADKNLKVKIKKEINNSKEYLEYIEEIGEKTAKYGKPIIIADLKEDFDYYRKIDEIEENMKYIGKSLDYRQNIPSNEEKYESKKIAYIPEKKLLFGSSKFKDVKESKPKRPPPPKKEKKIEKVEKKIVIEEEEDDDEDEGNCDSLRKRKLAVVISFSAAMLTIFGILIGSLITNA